MRAAALGVVRPPEIDDIRNAASRRTFAELKARASSLEDYEKLANTYADENEKLAKKMEALDEDLVAAQLRVLELEEREAAFVARAEKAEKRAVFREAQASQPSGPDKADEVDEEAGPPQAGETRFYKKKYSAKNHDVLVHVADCGCNNWESAHSADKARKGIAKLEGRDNWSSVRHCASCDGGGMWKVVW